MSYNFDDDIQFCAYCGGRLERRQRFGAVRPYCAGCERTYFADPKLAVAILVEQDGRLVLQRRTINPGLGKWTFPSGYVDRGEPPETAAVREVREEVGLEVRISHLIGLYSTPGEPVVVAVYAADPISGTVIAGDENDAAAYFSPDDLPELAFPHDAEIIADWQANWQAKRAGRQLPPSA